jgi:hypothetical protein
MRREDAVAVDVRRQRHLTRMPCTAGSALSRVDDGEQLGLGRLGREDDRLRAHPASTQAFPFERT